MSKKRLRLETREVISVVKKSSFPTNVAPGPGGPCGEDGVAGNGHACGNCHGIAGQGLQSVDHGIQAGVVGAGIGGMIGGPIGAIAGGAIAGGIAGCQGPDAVPCL
ncbi:MAG: hypothetical protein JRJ26_09550 [Deltaproteobacteria bacterium]|nr:hypothetical protein [Deltaproteobacteria bacterium]